MRIAYLLNQYPNVSCTFIRREILALEALGLSIDRVSIRHTTTGNIDPADEQERKKTFVLLDNVPSLLISACLWKVRHPLRSLSALYAAVQIGRRSHIGLAKHLIYFVEALALARWFTRRGIAHIHTHFGTNASTVALLTKIAGGPRYSMTIHGPEDFDSPIASALGQKTEEAEFVACISEFSRSQLFRWVSYDNWEKIQIIHCGIDDDFLRSPAVPVPPAPRLICVGRLCEQKGQLLLIKAVAALIRRGIAVELLLIGDGPMRGEIEALIAELRLGAHVKITGWQSNSQVRQHILSSRAMVLPSFAEGLPVVIMESLALHRPVITTYIAGIPELIEHGINGWLIPPGSLNKLEDCMAEALQLPAERLDEMGNAGANRVAELHDVKIEAAKLALLFSQQTSTVCMDEIPKAVRSFQ